MKPTSDNQLFLDSYEGEGLKTMWCWKNEKTGESSQEFHSKGAAMRAWRDGKLEWSRLEDLGD